MLRFLNVNFPVVILVETGPPQKWPKFSFCSKHGQCSETFAKNIFRFFYISSFSKILIFWNRFLRTWFRNTNQWSLITSWQGGFNAKAYGAWGRSGGFRVGAVMTQVKKSRFFSRNFIFFDKYLLSNFLRIIWNVCKKIASKSEQTFFYARKMTTFFFCIRFRLF